MKVILGADNAGWDLKNVVKNHLEKIGKYTIIDLSEEPAIDFVESSVAVGNYLVQEEPNSLGILFDAYAAGSFMAVTKIKGLVGAEVSDERTGYMTRRHNNARVITLGSQIVGNNIAKNIVDSFLSADYDGGRHQVRVDMLNKMG